MLEMDITECNVPDMIFKEEVIDDLHSSFIMEGYHDQTQGEDLKQEEDIKQEEDPLSEVQQTSYDYEIQENPNELVQFEIFEFTTGSQKSKGKSKKQAKVPMESTSSAYMNLNESGSQKMQKKKEESIYDDDEEVFEDLEDPQKLEKILSFQLHYECVNCKETFRTVQEIQEHIVNIHKDFQIVASEVSPCEYRNVYVCNICYKSIKSQDKIKKHLKQHMKNLHKFKCEYCCKGFPTKEMIAEHLKKFHFMKKTYVCKFCNKKFAVLAVLQHHVSKHEIRDLKCFYCEKVFKKIEKFQDHVTKDHCGLPFDPMNDPLCCTVCEDNFENLDDLRQHVRIHLVKESYQCPICKMIYSTASEISIHYSYYHEHVQRSSDFPNSLKIFTCRYTGKPVAGPKKTSFVKSEKNSVEAVAVTQQSNVGHSAGDADSVENLYDMLKTAKDGETQINLLRRSYKCPVCPRMLKTKSQMVDHMAKLHTDHKSFFCDHCTKVFTSKKGLQSHMSYHVTPKFVKCGICQKVMRDTFNLKSHMERHYNEACKNCDNCKNDLPCENFVVWALNGYNQGTKRYVCTICNKTYIIKENFRMHCLNHLSLLQHRPGNFTCEHCHKVFKSVTTLSTHIALHFPHTAKCLYCPKTYSKESSLENHVRDDHAGLPFILLPDAPFKCTICHEIHETLDNLKSHVKVHSVKTIWECGFCGHSYSTERGLRDHVKNNHKRKMKPSGFPNVWKRVIPFTEKIFSANETGGSIKTFKCTNCPLNFKTQNDLILHEKSHLLHKNVKRFPCTYCGLIFSSQEIKMNHEKKHMDQHEREAVDRMFLLLKKAVTSKAVVKGRDSSK